MTFVLKVATILAFCFGEQSLTAYCKRCLKFAISCDECLQTMKSSKQSVCNGRRTSTCPRQSSMYHCLAYCIYHWVMYSRRGQSQSTSWQHKPECPQMHHDSVVPFLLGICSYLVQNSRYKAFAIMTSQQWILINYPTSRPITTYSPST